MTDDVEIQPPTPTIAPATQEVPSTMCPEVASYTGGKDGPELTGDPALETDDNV